MTGLNRRRPALRHGWPIAVTLALSCLLLALVLTRIDIRTDMADLLPRGGTEPARFVLDQIRTGPATGLILLGIDGPDPTELARISRAMKRSLDHSGLFALVENGEQPGPDDPDTALLFRNRYLLSPAVTEAAFAVPALRTDFGKVLQVLQSSASALGARFGLSDPTGAFPALAEAWAGASSVRSEEGFWFAAGRNRALLLAATRAGGLDIAGQGAAVAAIDAAFAAARPGSATLLATGPPVFARDAAAAIRGDVERLSVISTVLVVALLLWRFRSPWVIAAIAVPVLLGIAAAALAVQAAFGFVHGVALGFGITMLGVTVDYPVLLIGHRKRGEAAAGTLRRIGQAFALAVATASLGLTGMLFSGFPGLAQLGLFSVVGILVAAAATRWLLPRLIVAADLAPVALDNPAGILAVERLRAGRGIGVAVCAAAALYLAWAGGLRWETDLTALSPVPQAMLAADATLRAELGAPDAGVAGLVRGADAEAVLRREEALLPLLDRLRAEGAIGGSEIAARLLPSVATQQARQAALPAPDDLARRVALARAGLPYREDAFRPFLDDVERSRTLPPVGPGDVGNGRIAARVHALLMPVDGGGWAGLVVPSDLRDAAKLRAALQGEGVAWVDTGAEAGAIVAQYTEIAWRWFAAGGAIAVCVLLAGTRDPWRVARIIASILAAGLVTLACLRAFDIRLTMINIVALQFAAGVGLDYALFFARPQLDDEERARTLRTLVICNLVAITTFGLLATCRTPLLRQIGITVVIGAVSAIIFAFLFAGPKPGRRAI
ncbi:MAG: MMPL family transporter [Acetobacteraceae bacterium]|nr:MMPL family transporter [Acetobacteraceae bacterium]